MTQATRGLPVVGDAANIVDAVHELSALNITIAVIGILPEGGNLAGQLVKNAVKEVSPAVRVTSKIDRAAFKSEKAAFWKAESQTNAAKYSKEDLVKMEKGQAPTGSDGHPMELHHVDGTMEGGITPMSRADHRGVGNYKDNHPWLFNEKE